MASRPTPVELARAALSTEGPRVLVYSLACLEATLYALAAEPITDLGGYDRVTLMQLCRNHIPHTGHPGQCFEYVVVTAIRDKDPLIEPLVNDAAETLCGIKGGVTAVPFSPEQNSARKLMDAAFK